MGKWTDIMAHLPSNNNSMRLKAAATSDDIAEVEKCLSVTLPRDVRELLLEFNGDEWLLYSVDEIIKNNQTVRKSYTCYMPLDCLLFIAHNGCGDYYGYPITKDGIPDNRIYKWEHETDSRTECAFGLEDLIRKYYTDHI